MIGSFVLAAAVAQGPALTVDEAVQIAMQSAFGIRTSQTQVGKADARLEQATSGVGLSIAATATYQRSQQSRPDEAFPGFQTGSNSQQLGLSVVQAIDISGAIGKSVESAKLGREAALRAVNSVEEAVKLQVRTQFFASLQAREALAIQVAAVEAAEARLKNVQILVREGAAPPFDALRLETELSRVKQEQIDARRAYDLARQQLNNTLARPISTEFEPAPLPALPPETPSSSPLIQAAIRLRPDLQQADLLVQSLEAFKIVEASGLKPSLAVSLNVNQAIAPNPNQSATQAFAAVKFTLPIWDGGSTRARVHNAKEDVNAAQIQLEQARLGAALEVEAAYTQYRSAVESYQVALQAEATAREALRLADLRYTEKVGILLDVISSQAELTRASRSRSAQFHAAWSAYSTLQKAVGADDLARMTSNENQGQ